jgi:hypothetical protein
MGEEDVAAVMVGWAFLDSSCLAPFLSRQNHKIPNVLA